MDSNQRLLIECIGDAKQIVKQEYSVDDMTPIQYYEIITQIAIALFNKI